MLRRRASAPVAPPSLPLGRGWVLPRWLERQIDPDSPLWLPGADDPTNLTGRNATAIGGLDSDRRALVDPAGLVVVGAEAWSIDVWFGVPGESDDDVRWIFPSSEAAQRQQLLDGVPVVETIVRSGGGDLVRRAGTARAGSDEAIVLDIINETPHPVAVAVVLRPFDLDGVAPVSSVETAGRSIRVGSTTAVMLDRDPGRALRSTLAGGDIAQRLPTDATGDGDGRTDCPAGLAHAGLVTPLVHGATLRATVAFGPVPEGGRRRRSAAETTRLPSPDDVPPLDAVARGWAVHADTGPTVTTPDPLLDQAIGACRNHLLLHASDTGLRPDPLSGAGSARDVALMAEALGRWGRQREATVAALALADRQDADGSLPGSDDAWAETAALTVATADHWRIHRDRALVADMAGPVTAAAAWLDQARREQDPPRFLDGFWAVRGLQDAGLVLRAAGLDEDAAAAAQAAAALRVDLLALADQAAAACAGVLPSSPDRRLDESCTDSLAASWPTGMLPPDHPHVANTAEYVADHFTEGSAVTATSGPRGLAVIPTLRLATAELRVGDVRAFERIRWILDTATPTWTWPKFVHPRGGTGTFGPHQYGPAIAGLLAIVHQMLVVDRQSPAGRLLAVCPTFAPEWRGIGWEAQDMPTSVGRFGFAVRWHGDRPALLWELDAFDDVERVTITAPGLDPAFSSTDHRGEVLLGGHTDEE